MKQRTSIRARADHALLLARERDELDVLAEDDAPARDRTRDADERARAGAVVVRARGSHAPEGAA